MESDTVGGEGFGDGRGDFGFFDKEVGLVPGNEGVGYGERIVGDVIATDVEEPSDFVEGGEEEVVGMVLVKCFAEAG